MSARSLTSHVPHDHPVVVGARRTSVVVAGLWATVYLAEAALTLWVRHAVKEAPPN